MYPSEIHRVFLCQTYARVEIKPADISLVTCGRVRCSPDKQSLDSVPLLRNVPSHPKGLSTSVWSNLCGNIYSKSEGIRERKVWNIWIFPWLRVIDREVKNGQERTSWVRTPCTLCIPGPATQRQTACTIISFTGAVCLRTISDALGEEESADECSCLLSVPSRGRGARRCNNFERQRWGGRRDAASGEWSKPSWDQDLTHILPQMRLFIWIRTFVMTLKAVYVNDRLTVRPRWPFKSRCAHTSGPHEHTQARAAGRRPDDCQQRAALVLTRVSIVDTTPQSLFTVRRGCRAAHDAVHVRMRLSNEPDQRMMWGRATWEGELKWLLGNWFGLHVKMVFKEAALQQCQMETADCKDGGCFTLCLKKKWKIKSDF